MGRELEICEAFCKECFGTDPNVLHGLKTLPRQPTWLKGAIQLVVIPKDLTILTVLDYYRELGVPVLCTIDDMTMLKSARRNRETYALWAPMKNNAGDGIDRGILKLYQATPNTESITLLERLVLGLMHFMRTGTHLDEGTMTLCCGSIYAAKGGPISVPAVDFGPHSRKPLVSGLRIVLWDDGELKNEFSDEQASGLELFPRRVYT